MVSVTEKLFQCKFCESKLVQNCSLKRHENAHMNEKCWICHHQNCGKRFKLKEYLEATYPMQARFSVEET